MLFSVFVVDSCCDWFLFYCVIYRGSYMSAHVLLNLLNEFGEKR